ncbi:MAG: hypothetical protein V4449_00155 [Patescibacteria group bacterium]
MVAEAFHGQTPEKVARDMFLAEKALVQQTANGDSGSDQHVPDLGFRLNVLNRILGVPHDQSY